MLNDKVLKSVADAVTKVMAEALKGDQHKIDKNKNNKIDAHDFKLLRKEETVTEEEKKKSPFDWKNTPRETREKGELTGHASKRTSTGTVYTKKAVKEEASQEEFNKEIEKAKAKASGKVAQPEVAKPAVQAVQQEEVEQIEAEALIENYEMINEVSVGAKIRAYAQHSRDAFDHNDMGNEDEADRHSERASKIMKHIEKHHGPEAVKHAEKAGRAAIFGRDDPHGHGDGGHDVLHGGLRSNKTVTKAGKVPKGTQSAMKNKIMAYGRHRDTAGPKGHLPEEVQQIDELSKKTLGSYIKKAANDKADIAYHRGYDNYDQKPDWTPMKAKVHYGQQNRNRGIKRAVARLVQQEETQQEEVQQIDELSRRTLGNYIKKAANDKADIAYHAGHSSYSKPDWTPMKDKVHDGQENRNRGIKRAINKLTREEAEQIDERHLTSGEKADVEKNVKGMKKNLQGFKARYGKDAKSVMYATATKQAKGE